MLRQIIYMIIFIIGITLNTIWVPIVLVIRILRLRKIDRWLGKKITGIQSKIYMSILGVKVSVSGKEHCRGLDGLPLCVISNHQGILDIPIIIGWIPFPCGFVAKQELAYLPPFFVQMWYLRCVLINRSSPRSAVRAIERGVVNIKRGYPMLIFPEGTRSRGPGMGEFKHGSLKLAIRSEATILPVTVNGTYKALEETGKAKAADISLVIHEPISIKGMSREELKDLHLKLREVIGKGLKAE